MLMMPVKTVTSNGPIDFCATKQCRTLIMWANGSCQYGYWGKYVNRYQTVYNINTVDLGQMSRRGIGEGGTQCSNAYLVISLL
jgi:hypothetical protein